MTSRTIPLVRQSTQKRTYCVTFHMLITSRLLLEAVLLMKLFSGFVYEMKLQEICSFHGRPFP